MNVRQAWGMKAITGPAEPLLSRTPRYERNLDGLRATMCEEWHALPHGQHGRWVA